MPNLSDFKSTVLSVVRRGPRTVLWTPELFGFGNILYVWLQAHARQAAGVDTRALLTTTGERWLPLLDGRVDRLVVRRPDVRLTDRREPGAPFVFGKDFTREQLDSFLDDVVLPSALADPTAATVVDHDDVVVVVRRGDYWSVPLFRSRYAFDIGAYIRAALALQLEAGGRVGRVHVVSDGLDWCRTNLGWLAEDGRRLTFATSDQTPRDHFATMVGARRLVVTNTTFGYWGGYGATRRHGTSSIVVAPRFHARHIPRGERAVTLDPRWSIVETIDGGWIEPSPSPTDDLPDTDR